MVKSTITRRLFLSFLSAALLAVCCMFFALQWSIDNSFFRYVQLLEHARFEKLAEDLEEAYQKNGSWNFLRGKPDRWLGILAATLPRSELPPPLALPERAAPVSTLEGTAMAKFARNFERRIVLLDQDRQPIFGPGVQSGWIEKHELVSEGRSVGQLALLPRKDLTELRQLGQIKQQKQAVAVLAIAVLLLVAGFSLPLANRLVRPLKGLAAASHRMAAGEYAVRVPVTSSDELGQLAGDFNVLASALEQNEKARKQWVADISHELRTPLTALCAVTEALEDGVREATPETIRALNRQALRLGRLVDDLYQLSLSDLGALAYRKERVDLAAALRQSAQTYLPEFSRKGVALKVELPERAELPLFADPVRLQQLFGNLFCNSANYTDAGGTLLVTLARDGDRIILDFIDSAPGVPEAELPRLFDRLYRADSSRSRLTGGAGLGLAICRNIVEAHGGTIAAQPSPMGGVWIRITWPAMEG